MKKVILILVLLSASLQAQTIYFPPLSGDGWDTLNSGSLGWNQTELQNTYEYLRQKNTKAFIILKNGKIVVEWYFDSFNKDSIWYWASAGKTITAFLVGKAQEEGYLSIYDKTSKYLGKGWTSLTEEKEDLITIRHQLTMTTGLDDGVSDNDCSLKECLQYKADAGTRWAYHNAPYTLLGKVIENATGQSRNNYTTLELKNKIGMNGLWITTGYNEVYYSNARSMARFGLLISNNGIWNEEKLLNDEQYLSDMINTSQNLNLSYGYLWWLNGKGSYMLPQLQVVFNTNLIPEAPDDVIAALGKNDQKIYIAKSLGLVVIRMGNSADNPKLALSSFDNELWGYLMKAVGTSSSVEHINNIPSQFKLEQNYPNPFNPSTTIRFSLPKREHVTLKVFDVLGREVATLVDGAVDTGEHAVMFNATALPSGIYFYQITTQSFSKVQKAVLLK